MVMPLAQGKNITRFINNLYIVTRSSPTGQFVEHINTTGKYMPNIFSKYILVEYIRDITNGEEWLYEYSFNSFLLI